jgi:predicted Zn-dependent protease
MATSAAKHPQPGHPNPLVRLGLLWGALVLVAAVALLALHFYQERLVYHLAYTSAPPARQAAFLVEQADRLFEEARAGRAEERGLLSDDPKAQEAKALYTKSIALLGRPSNSGIYEKMAVLASYMGDDELMHQYHALGFMFGPERNFDAAIEAAEQTTTTEGQVILGQALAGADRLDDAITVVEELEAADPDNLELLTLKADLLNRQKKVDESNELLARVIAQQPDNIPVAIQLANQHFAQKNYDESAEVIEAAIKQSPNDPGLRHRLGLIHMEADQPEKAVDAFRAAIDILDTQASFFLDLRAAHLRLNQPNQAHLALQQAMALDSKLVNKRLSQNK